MIVAIFDRSKKESDIPQDTSETLPGDKAKFDDCGVLIQPFLFSYRIRANILPRDKVNFDDCGDLLQFKDSKYGPS